MNSQIHLSPKNHKLPLSSLQILIMRLMSQAHSSPKRPLVQKSAKSLKEECEFLEGLQERLLVLFEGLKAEHNQNIKSTLHITIHFLEHQLNVIQERLEILKK